MPESWRNALPALLATLLGLLVHPLVLPRLGGLPGARFVLPALAAATVVSLALAARKPSERFVAAGAVAVLVGLGYDAARGQAGTLTLAIGEAAHLFDEQGPNGAALGLRPLGFEVRLDAYDGVTAELALPGGRALLRKERAVLEGGVTLAQPRSVHTGEAARLRLAVTQPEGRQEVSLVPPDPVRAGDLEIALDRYFPDFALDDQRQPYSRSLDPVNPAALLKVRSPSAVFSVFVIRSMPGVHIQPGLPATFALVDVDPLVALQIAVFREPLAPLCLLGLVVVGCGVALGIRRS
jgi:hypothetical protein